MGVGHPMKGVKYVFTENVYAANCLYPNPDPEKTEYAQVGYANVWLTEEDLEDRPDVAPKGAKRGTPYYLVSEKKAGTEFWIGPEEKEHPFQPDDTYVFLDPMEPNSGSIRGYFVLYIRKEIFHDLMERGAIATEGEERAPHEKMGKRLGIVHKNKHKEAHYMKEALKRGGDWRETMEVGEFYPPGITDDDKENLRIVRDRLKKVKEAGRKKINKDGTFKNPLSSYAVGGSSWYEDSVSELNDYIDKILKKYT